MKLMVYLKRKRAFLGPKRKWGLDLLGWAHVRLAGVGFTSRAVGRSSLSLSLLRRTCSRVVHLGVRDPAGVSGRFNLVFIRVTGASWRWWAPASTPRVPEAEGEATGRVQIPLQNLPHPVRQSASALSALPVAGLPLPCRAHGSQVRGVPLAVALCSCSPCAR